MTELSFKFDEIGIWSELKLEIIEQYGTAYTKAFARTKKTTSTHSAVRAGMSQRKRKRRWKEARRAR